MATYDELLTIANTGETFFRRMQVAAVIAAEKIRTEPASTANHANRLLWAKSVFLDPATAGRNLLWPVLAQNRTQTSAVILAATDAALQTAVDAAVDVLATGA